MFGLGGMVAGILLILVGGALIFFFPSAVKYQPQDMGILVIIVGFVMVIIGAIFIFV